MRKLVLALLFVASNSFAGFVVMEAQVRPLAPAQAYWQYDVQVERQFYPSGGFFYTMSFYPQFICTLPSGCARPVQPFPSHLILNGSYYDTCNGYVQNSWTRDAVSPIRSASLVDNSAWGCAYPPLGQIMSRVYFADGTFEDLVGFRIR